MKNFQLDLSLILKKWGGQNTVLLLLLSHLIFMPNLYLKAQGSGGAGQGGEGPSCEFSVTIDQHGLATVNNLVIAGICNRVIDWGDGCVNVIPTNDVMVKHQYTKCGTFIVKNTIYTGSIPCTPFATCEKTITAEMPAVFVELTTASDVNNDCGVIRKLIAKFKLRSGCNPAIGSINVYGDIPDKFDIVGGTFSTSTNPYDVFTTVSANEINSGTATREIWLLPKWCSGNSFTPVILWLNSYSGAVTTTSNPLNCDINPQVQPYTGDIVKWNLLATSRCPMAELTQAACQVARVRVMNTKSTDQVTIDFGDGFIANNDLDVSHYYISPGLKTVNITISSTCGTLNKPRSVTYTKTINLSSCETAIPCGCPNGLNINAPTGGEIKLSEIAGLGPVIDLTNDYNGCMAIQGRLIIDRDVEIKGSWFGNADVRMAPISSIIVQPHKLIMRDLNIHGCNGMWNGIKVEPYGEIEFISNTISDALEALQVEGSLEPCFGSCEHTKMKVIGNTFAKNGVGIKLTNEFIAGKITISAIEDNTFDGEGPFAPGFPANLTQGYAGIESFYNDVYVGSPQSTSYSNWFSNFDNGIDAIGKGVFVYNAYFDNIRSNLKAITNGAGISLRDIKNSQISNCYFENSDKAVGSNNSRLNMDNCETADVINGVTANVSSLNIKDNHIGFLEYGILSYDHIGPLDIKDNTLIKEFDANAEFPAAISLQSGTPNARIENNSIQILDRADGIALNNIVSSLVSGNYISFTNPKSKDAYGIALSYSKNNRIQGNHVGEFALGSPSTSGNTIGIATLAGTGNTYCCNVTEGNEIGAEWAFTCMGTDFRLHTAQHHYNSILCQEATRISEQPDRHNRFNATSGRAEHLGFTDEVFDSRFLVYDEDQNVATYEGIPWWPEVLATPGFFLPSENPINLNLNCGNDVECNKPFPMAPPTGLREGDRRTAQGLYQYPNSSLQWESELYLYGRIKEGLVPASADPDVYAFYQNAHNTAVGKHYFTDSLMRHLKDVPLPLSNEMQQLNAYLTLNHDLASQKWSELVTALNASDSLRIYAETDSLRDLARPKYARLQVIEAILDSLFEERALAAYNNVEHLPTPQLMAENRKTVYGIWLERLLLDSFQLNPQQFNIIGAIAHQCPDQGGTAVFLARALYLRNELAPFRDDSLCNWIALREKRENIEKKSAIGFSIAPNPAQNEIQIRLGTPPRDPYIHIMLIDVTGQQCKLVSVVHTDAKVVLDLGDLPQGMYFCSLVADGLVLPAQKVIVQH